MAVIRVGLEPKVKKTVSSSKLVFQVFAELAGLIVLVVVLLCIVVICSDRLSCSFLVVVLSFWCQILVGFCETWCFRLYLTIGCFNRPSAAPSQSVQDICDNAESMMLNNEHILGCGDVNIDMSDLNKPLFQTFHYFITSPNQYPHPQEKVLHLQPS